MSNTEHELDNGRTRSYKFRITLDGRYIARREEVALVQKLYDEIALSIQEHGPADARTRADEAGISPVLFEQVLRGRTLDQALRAAVRSMVREAVAEFRENIQSKDTRLSNPEVRLLSDPAPRAPKAIEVAIPRAEAEQLVNDFINQE